ncbi:hypothetical protein DL768_009591 [Monosporascus sp. mg162]|nr:hypothetical protein DL768_009591 [Monosporascus sp. mg162]
MVPLLRLQPPAPPPPPGTIKLRNNNNNNNSTVTPKTRYTVTFVTGTPRRSYPFISGQRTRGKAEAVMNAVNVADLEGVADEVAHKNNTIYSLIGARSAVYNAVYSAIYGTHGA